MYAKLQRLIDRHSHNFITGNILPILPIYAPVLPVYIAGNRVTLGSVDEIAATLESHFLDIRRKGFDQVKGNLSAMTLPRGGRFQAIVDWTYSHHAGVGGPTGRTTYYCRMEGGSPIVEMMEYPRLAFESACEWYSERLEPELLTGT